MSRSVNLLPANFRRGELLHRRQWQWGTLWALATLIAVPVASARFLAHNDAERAQLEVEQRQTDRLAKSEKRLADAQAKLSALRAQEAILLNPTDETPGLLVLGIVSRCARRIKGAVHVEGLSLARMGATPGTQSPSATPLRKDPEGLLTLKGTAADSLAVANFTTGLRDSGVFASVQRKSSGTQEIDEKRPVPYLIECRF
jgi:hypothetical protein